eukprot:TRINITY_DN81197_c0_g1_i1.p1 TRINITY_DN81197_c0_g1~~TRINITY_DN81197_c0_g1_i1.p1  ORF type:complete len:363 (+),score=79.43 TRINITY_DN81197_c0_g1_i1:181-1269(+)
MQAGCSSVRSSALSKRRVLGCSGRWQQLGRRLGGRRHLSSYWEQLLGLRQKMVMENFEKSRKLGNILGNGGYLVGLLEYGVTDIWWLRVFAMCGGVGIISWQLLQPRVQPTTTIWNATYFLVNSVMLSRLKTVPIPDPSVEEAKLHDMLGGEGPPGLSKRQFRELMDAGELLWLVDGFQLEDAFRIGDDKCFFLIVDGVCDVLHEGKVVAQFGPGSAVGEVGALADTLMNGSNVVASGSVRCFAAPARAVQELLDADPSFREALDSVFTQSLTAKLASMNEQAKVRNYRAMLEVACLVSSEVGVDKSVRSYRSRHRISEETHDSLLEELSQCIHRPFRGKLPATAAESADSPQGVQSPMPSS